MAYTVSNRKFGQVIGRCALALGLNYSGGEFDSDSRKDISGDLLASVKEIVNRAQQHVQDIVGLDKLRQRHGFDFPAATTSGYTLTAAAGATTITSDNDIFADTDVGRYLKLNDRWYRIITKTDAKNVIIECATPEAVDETIKLYTVFYELGSAGSNIFRTLDTVAWPDVGELDLVDLKEIESDDPEWTNTGSNPTRCSWCRHNKAPALRFDPIPASRMTFFAYGVRFPTLLTDDATFTDLPEECSALWDALSAYEVCLQHGSEKQIAREKAKLDMELNSLGLAEEPEVDMYLRYAEKDTIWDTSSKTID